MTIERFQRVFSSLFCPLFDIIQNSTIILQYFTQRIYRFFFRQLSVEHVGAFGGVGGYFNGFLRENKSTVIQ